jgi:Icc-related predicted phosphoesterase
LQDQGIPIASTTCFFASDLHGSRERYRKLLQAVLEQAPGAVFLGGDLFPSGLESIASVHSSHDDFIADTLVPGFERLRGKLMDRYPLVFLILGNDDGRHEEPAIQAQEKKGLWIYAHDRKTVIDGYAVYGYACIPPTPFLFKDWEKYDVSRYVDPGCVSPEEGYRSVPVRRRDRKYSTIKEDLENLAGEDDLKNALFLFHAPPHRTLLDRAALDGKKVDHVPLDVHVGSIAIRRFIARRQPLVTMHGHIHESAAITGSWRDRIGKTHLFSAAHDGPELALVVFDLEHLDEAERRLL